jgi:two-component system OmpR family sensor kinase
MGLGLSFVQATAKAHGGRVECESSPGCGATFRVFLPA